MVKTTINLDDEIYADIVKESIEKYGSTRNMSRIVNQRLRKKTTEGGKEESESSSRSGKTLHHWMQTVRLERGGKGAANENHG
ncbi:hypothetical protein B2A_14041 [mine drainage metagenome]|uniref:Uncharacterized protein n=1 Tax=mine drainage metagenome TaxID=410659 RepID=T0YC45_9ZZZZ